MTHTDPAQVDKIIAKVVSRERLDSQGATNPSEKVDRHVANIIASSLFYAILHQLELSMRNRWEKIFLEKFGNDWFNQTRFIDILEPYARDELNKVKTKLDGAVKFGGQKGKKKRRITSGQVVSSLGFSFWTSLFGKHYEETLWRKHGKIILPDAGKSERNISVIRDELRQLRKLRNRIAHQEPICSREGLREDYERCIKYIKWYNGDYYAWMDSSDISDCMNYLSESVRKKVNNI